jgi:hypothetical protein
MKSGIRMNCLWLCILPWIPNDSAKGAEPPAKPTKKVEAKLPGLLAGPEMEEDSADDAMRKLLKARYNALLREARDNYDFEAFAKERGPSLREDPDHLYGLWRRLLKSALQLSSGPGEKEAVLKKYLEMTMDAEKLARQRHEAGRWRIGDVERARYERLDAEIRLLQAQTAATNKRDK